MSDKKPSPKIETPPKKAQSAKKPTEKEVNGFDALGLPEPTRYGDWEVKGRCSDF